MGIAKMAALLINVRPNARPFTVAHLVVLVTILMVQDARASIHLATTAAGINNSGGAIGANTSGTHYHFSPNPTTMFLDRWFSEEGRAVAEFNLSSVASPVASATLSFTISGYGSPPLWAPMQVVAYDGDNAISLSDFQATSLGTISAFNTTGQAIGTTFSFDVSSFFNSQIGDSLGIRVQLTSDPGTEAVRTVRFNNIRIETVDAEVVPESSTLLTWTGLGLIAGCWLWRKRDR
jgi:hypothetical protein